VAVPSFGYQPPMEKANRAVIEALWDCSRYARESARETRLRSHALLQESEALRAMRKHTRSRRTGRVARVA
jgi:hypothetical protein